MNRQEIRNKARKMLGETTAAFWTDNELNGWIDDACDAIAMRTLCIRASTTATTTENTMEYAFTSVLPSGLAIINASYYMDASSWQPLEPTSQEELDRDESGWRSATSGTPQKYYWDLQENILGIYPKPNSTNAGAYFKIRHANRHIDIATETSTIDIPLELHSAIIENVVFSGLETRGQREQAAYHVSKYESYLMRWMAARDFNRHLDNDIIMIPGGR